MPDNQSGNPAQEQEATLLVADRDLSPVERQALLAKTERRRLLLLDLTPAEDLATGNIACERLRIDSLLCLDDFHASVTSFLDRWPRETLVDGRPFDDVFRQTTGESLWWTGPGSQRHPFSGPIVPYLRIIWLVRRTVEGHAASRVILHTRDRKLATVVASVSRGSGVRCQSLDGSIWSTAGPSWLSTLTWSLRSSAAIVAYACWILLRSLYARLLTQPSQGSPEASPTVIMSGWYPNHVGSGADDRPVVTYWKRLADALHRQCPEVRVRYLLHTTTLRFHGWKRVLRPVYTGWSRLRHVEEALPLTHCTPQLGAYLSGARHQWNLMRVYARSERSHAFQEAGRFEGADVSCLLVPHLRAAVASMARWSRNVAATASVIRSAGGVRMVLVHEEFYPKGMLTIAATRALGLPTVGVQHGLIGPQHTVYMPPPGQLRDGPVPDLFAAYGDYAAQVLSRAGSYPREQIHVLGAPRFDGLADSLNRRMAARRVLEFPEDRTIILLTTETFRLSAPIIRALIPVAEHHPQWRFVIKLHPHDRAPADYDALVSRFAPGSVEIVRDRLSEIMAACDVVVTGYSTTAIEALMVGRAVVCADFTTWPERYPLVAGGVAYSARRPDALRGAIEQALKNKGAGHRTRGFLQEHLGPTVEGRAADQFARLIHNALMRPLEYVPIRPKVGTPDGLT